MAQPVKKGGTYQKPRSKTVRKKRKPAEKIFLLLMHFTAKNCFCYLTSICEVIRHSFCSD